MFFQLHKFLLINMDSSVCQKKYPQGRDLPDSDADLKIGVRERYGCSPVDQEGFL
jgi:hypothetical protein